MTKRSRMSKLPLLAVLLALIAAAEPSPAQDGQPAQTSAKVIADKSEYDAYMSALNTADPAQKAAAMETFIGRYPRSVVRIEAMEQAMAGYQQASNQAGVEDVANRILQSERTNVRALAIMAFILRNKG